MRRILIDGHPKSILYYKKDRGGRVIYLGARVTRLDPTIHLPWFFFLNDIRFWKKATSMAKTVRMTYTTTRVLLSKKRMTKTVSLVTFSQFVSWHGILPSVGARRIDPIVYGRFE